MDDPHHITDDEYRRIVHPDEAGEDADPWQRIGPYGKELLSEPVKEIGTRENWKPRQYPDKSPSMYCQLCHNLRIKCLCDLGYH